MCAGPWDISANCHSIRTGARRSLMSSAGSGTSPSECARPGRRNTEGVLMRCCEDQPSPMRRALLVGTDYDLAAVIDGCGRERNLLLSREFWQSLLLNDLPVIAGAEYALRCDGDERTCL